MPRGKGIIGTLGGDRKASQPAPGTQRVEGLTASRQQLVHIGLMPYVPDDPILRRVVDVVQGDGDLYDPEVRPEVPGIDRERL